MGLVAILCLATLPAQALDVIDFESFTAISNTPNAAVPVASRASTQILETDGVSFRSGSAYAAVVNLGVSVRGDFNGVGGLVTLQAFDGDGLLLDTNFQTDAGGPTLQISAFGIHSVRFFSDTANVAFDDSSFGPIRAVPEPVSSWVIGSGVPCLAGLSTRRDRRRRPAAPGVVDRGSFSAILPRAFRRDHPLPNGPLRACSSECRVTTLRRMPLELLVPGLQRLV